MCIYIIFLFLVDGKEIFVNMITLFFPCTSNLMLPNIHSSTIIVLFLVKCICSHKYVFKLPDRCHFKVLCVPMGMTPWGLWVLVQGTKSLVPGKEAWSMKSCHIWQTQAGMFTKTKHLDMEIFFIRSKQGRSFLKKIVFGDTWRLGLEPVSLVNNSLVFMFSLGIVSPDATN